MELPWFLNLLLGAYLLCAGALLGCLFKGRCTLLICLLCAFAGAIFGVVAWGYLPGPLSLVPVILAVGAAAGSAIEMGISRKKIHEAEDWKRLAIDAEATGKFHIYLSCAETAGDFYKAAGDHAAALEQYMAAWNKQVRKHPVHLTMVGLGEKLITCLKQCNRAKEAEKIQAAIVKARSAADEILEEELWDGTPSPA